MNNVCKLILVTVSLCLIAACEKSPAGTGDHSGGCKAIDLGLTTTDGKPVKWASWNVGAKSEEEPGLLFAWGETEAKDYYGWDSGKYKWGSYDGDAEPLCGMTGYTASFEGGDGLSVLQPGDDAATVNWGKKWRMPTAEEIQDLIYKCEWTWDESRNGYVVKGPSENTIFLPVTGFYWESEWKGNDEYGEYWSSSVGEMAYEACCLDFAKVFHVFEYDSSKCIGMAVRAVTDF